MNLVKNSLNIFRKYSTKQKISVQISDKLNDDLNSVALKHRKHPGVHSVTCTSLPARIIKAITISMKDYPVTAICREAEIFHRYLLARKLPAEVTEVREKRQKIEQIVEDELNLDKKSLTQEEIAHFNKIKNNKVEKILKQKVYAWKQINYDLYKSFQYMCGRSALEYAVLYKIFAEVAKRHPNFKPNSFFDFGSGIGTGTWAASYFWKQSIHEYYLVDSSNHMNELSDLILRDGDINKEITLKTVYHRQFLPSSKTKYDVVLSAFSLFELPSSDRRKEVLKNLWEKCDDYLIIVENGTAAGFQAINEARNYILQIAKDEGNAHIFAPCPHDLTCPRVEANDGTPCNFQVTYNDLTFSHSLDTKQENYSYVVIKKGPRPDDDEYNWNRIVRPTLVRSRHVICRMCTKNGGLEEVIFTSSKFGKNAYRCAKASKLGDRIPFQIEFEDSPETDDKK